MGKFISRDPIGIADDVNLYAYVGNSPMMFVDRMGNSSKSFITEKLIVSIFNLAMSDAGGFNFIVFQEATRSGGAFDIKRNEYIKELASKNGGIINFNGVNVEPSNLGNLLAGFNMKNSYLPSWKVRSRFMEVEIDNARYIDGFGQYSEKIAEYDERSDEVWYDAGESLFGDYKKTSSQQEKINIITKAISQTTPEYLIRSLEEQEQRRFYRNLLSK